MSDKGCDIGDVPRVQTLRPTERGYTIENRTLVYKTQSAASSRSQDCYDVQSFEVEYRQLRF